MTINILSATTLRIMDVYGKLYTQQTISEGQNTINLSALPTGILIFVVGDRRFKVLKE
ncbi:MAG: T9SS type A sorting domain-containing protein [Saprospiraceae bacterium]|nr:T9SS type A sorting domain-containing protein [Saprospiraceae bacterium]MBK9563858.1 T9SS type A sorting domain-containing protein [Saprospiraceae bacterium]MBP6446935.1 T9SS type A sorting domain-containing protein [Saprospiraceae bacterium]